MSHKTGHPRGPTPATEPVGSQVERGVRPPREWVTYDPLTATYDTPDGTSVAAEIVDNVQCLADVLHIAQIRAKQRAERPNRT